MHERIHISFRCHMNFALDAAVDGLSEEELVTSQIGMTKKGIRPAYSGSKVIDLYHESFEQRLRSLSGGYCKRYYKLFKYPIDDETQRFSR